MSPTQCSTAPVPSCSAEILRLGSIPSRLLLPWPGSQVSLNAVRLSVVRCSTRSAPSIRSANRRRPKPWGWLPVSWLSPSRRPTLPVSPSRGPQHADSQIPPCPIIAFSPWWGSAVSCPLLGFTPILIDPQNRLNSSSHMLRVPAGTWSGQARGDCGHYRRGSGRKLRQDQYDQGGGDRVGHWLEGDGCPRLKALPSWSKRSRARNSSPRCTDFPSSNGTGATPHSPSPDHRHRRMTGWHCSLRFRSPAGTPLVMKVSAKKGVRKARAK